MKEAELSACKGGSGAGTMPAESSEFWVSSSEPGILSCVQEELGTQNPEQGTVLLARVRRPQGLRGELRLEVLTDFPEHICKLEHVLLALPGKPLIDVQIESARLVRDGAVIKTTAAHTIDEAETLVGAELHVFREEAWPLPLGSYFHFDLIGCTVLLKDGAPVGKITGITGSQNPLLKVAAAAGGEVVLIPFCEDICYRIEPSLKQVWINPPEGLLELNAI